MQEVRSPAQEAAEDIFFGQLVIIVARWFLILAATILVLWNAADAGQLVTSIIPVIALIIMNFYLHGRYLVERPANQAFILAASLLDLLIITVLVLIGPGGKYFASPLFVLYYPVLLAFGFVFPRRYTSIYTVVVMGAYILASLPGGAPFIRDTRDLKILVERMTIFATVGFLASFYWRIQRDRLRAAMGGSARIQELPARG